MDNINKQIISKEDVDFAVVVVDINDLKKVNDSYGHEYGEGVAIAVYILPQQSPTLS